MFGEKCMILSDKKLLFQIPYHSFLQKHETMDSASGQILWIHYWRETV